MQCMLDLHDQALQHPGHESLSVSDLLSHFDVYEIIPQYAVSCQGAMYPGPNTAPGV